MMAFGWFLYRADGSRAVVEEFLAAGRAGRAPLALDDGAARALAGRRAVSIDNFIISNVSGCYWTTIEGSQNGAAVPLELFVEKQHDGWRVTAATLARRCHCPKGRPCALDP